MRADRHHVVAFLLAGGLFLLAVPRTARPDSNAFVTAAGRVPPAAAQPRAVASGGAGDAASLTSFCGLLTTTTSSFDACTRNGQLAEVAMRSQGQGGRASLGQRVKGRQLKGAKKMAVLRPRKLYGSHGARKVPRRYPLYDILEMMDERVPTYTIISQPEEPLEPVYGVPLVDRYPWAGSLEKVHKRKQEKEHGTNEDRMEPFFGSWTGAGMPPMGRRQRYVARRGFPTYNSPPWLNRPLIGHEGMWKKVDGHTAWKRHRGEEHLAGAKQNEEKGRMARLEADMDDDDELDRSLQAMEDANK